MVPAAAARGLLAPLLGLLLLVQPAAAGREAAVEAQPLEGKAAIDAHEAEAAAESAKAAAHVAKQVTARSIRMTKHTQAALRRAKEALKDVRLQAVGLSDNQTKALRKAEDHLRQATQTTEFDTGVSKDAAFQEKLDRLKEKLARQQAKQQGAQKSELEEMRRETRSLRQKLAGTIQEQRLEEIEKLLKEMESQQDEAALSHDELKAELERLHDAINRFKKRQREEEEAARKEEAAKKAGKGAADTNEEDAGGAEEARAEGGRGEARRKDRKEAAAEERRGSVAKSGYAEKDQREEEESPAEGTPKEEPPAAAGRGAVDVNVAMPYGDLEPFGREDTAQELTEASIRESNGMVDQLERAEVAEEKRAIFRALTRLRGAAITSFDGVARAQTGNIDEYNEAHQWRAAHPLKHLAHEESDISKWAFPDSN